MGGAGAFTWGVGGSLAGCESVCTARAHAAGATLSAAQLGTSCASLRTEPSPVGKGGYAAPYVARDSSDLQSFRSASAACSADGFQTPKKVKPESRRQSRARWRKEIMGPGHITWKRDELESAVTSTCIIERAVMAEVPVEGALTRSRSEDVLMEERLRRMGDAAIAHVRELEKSGPEREKLLQTVRLFQLPSSGTSFTAVSGKRSAVADYLDVADAQKHKCKARNTWACYKGPMKKARAYLRTAILADGREWCVETFRRHPEYVRSVAGWAYATTSSASAVESMVLAVRLCMRFNNVAVEDDFATKAVREVTKRERSKAPHRRAAITRDEVLEIVRAWAGASECKRMMACVVGLGFQCLLRWADMALIHIDAIYWYTDGCVFALPRRKNAQHKPELVAFADTGGEGSLFKVFRAHCESVAGQAMPREGQSSGTNRFAFRQIVKPTGASGHTWSGKRCDMMDKDSVRPINRSAYKKYLVRFKDALVECCGMTRPAVAEFGMHSMRVGGDTWLFENNMPASVRMRMGGWASAFSEKTYIRTLVAERLMTCKAMGI